jgi:hypothetical protein
MLNSSLFEQPLSEQERALRDLFVNEYLKDFDAYQACIRVGFLQTFAADMARQFMGEGYVQRQITYMTRKPDEDESAAALADKALIENTLRQACQHGPYASRVAAAARLAEMRGLSKPDGTAEAESTLIDAFKEFAQRAPV